MITITIIISIRENPSCVWILKFRNSSAPPPDLHPPPLSPSVRGTWGGNVFPPPLVGGVRGGGWTVTKFLCICLCKCSFYSGEGFKLSPALSPLTKGDKGGCVFLGYPRSPFSRGQVSRGQVYNPQPPFLRGILYAIHRITRLNKMKILIKFYTYHYY